MEVRMNRVAEKILREVRKKHGYTQEDLAKILGLTQSQVSKIERGACAMDADYLIFLLSQLGTDDLRELLKALVEALTQRGEPAA